MTTRQLAVEVKTVAVKAILLLKMKVAEPMVVLQMVNQTKLKEKGWNSKSKFKLYFHHVASINMFQVSSQK